MKSKYVFQILFITVILVYFFDRSEAQPVAGFSMKEKICSGTVAGLINTSTGAHTYQWHLRQLPAGSYNIYSAGKDTSVILPVGEYIIRLIATDTISKLSDTVLKYVRAADSSGKSVFMMYADYASCPGDTVLFTSNREAVSQTWDFNTPQLVTGGCTTCPSISIITKNLGEELKSTVVYDGGCTDIIVYTFFTYKASCDTATGFGTPPASRLKIYPNPVQDKLTISGLNDEEVKSIEIYGTSGALVYQRHSPAIRFTIDMEGMASGMYYLKINTVSGTITKKITRY